MVNNQVPQYWNIIDPNMNVSLQRVGFRDPLAIAELPQNRIGLAMGNREAPFHFQWVATDVLVTEETPDFYLAARVMGQQRARQRVLRAHLASRVHLLPPGRHVVLYLTIEKVLTAALPLLARLRRPALMLPGPLQVVIKSQRMLLERDASLQTTVGGAGSNLGEGAAGDYSFYSGVWHIDGKHERVVAVVLYYFEKVNLVGGDLEFADKCLRSEQVCWVVYLNHVQLRWTLIHTFYLQLGGGGRGDFLLTFCSASGHVVCCSRVLECTFGPFSKI